MRALVSALAFAALLAAPAFAAEDGTEGATSAGSFSVGLTIDPPPAPIVCTSSMPRVV
jgi:hypothetical protein